MAALCRICMYWSASVFFRRMANSAVLCILWPDSRVSCKFISHQVGTLVNFLADCASYRRHSHVCNDATAKLTAAFNGNEYRGFAGSASPFAGPFVARPAGADVCVLSFYDS